MILEANFTENIKLLLFDLDDTLISEEKWYLDKWEKCDLYIQEKYNVKGFFEKILQIIDLKGFDYSKKVDDTLVQLNVSEKIPVQEIVDYYLNVEVTPVVFSNVFLILKELKKNFHLGIITSGKKWEQILKIRLSKLDEFFSFVEVIENKSKDSTSPFLKCLDYFKISPTNTFYIGNDPINDFVGAKKLGIKTIRLLQGLKKDIIVNKNLDSDLNFKSLEDFNNHLKNSFL